MGKYYPDQAVFARGAGSCFLYNFYKYYNSYNDYNPMKTRVSIIVAMDKNRLIGGENKLLWNIPGELKRFKEITTGHPIIMGRKTHQSIGRVLPNRTNIIITRDPDYKVDGAIVVNSLEQAIEKASAVIATKKQDVSVIASEAKQSEPPEIFVIGGGQIYAQALPLADRLYLTIVDGDYKGDTYFPDYSAFDKVVEEKYFNEAGIKYKTLILEKA